jgi:hypothetical protein
MPLTNAPKPEEDESHKLVCGVVMPISAIDGCPESHWSDVHEILSEGIGDAGFEANMVSNADDVGIVHKRIIQNLYDNPIVVCDVSGKNPNVMFELGLRLAFDKPTIIVKDDKTSYSFDTAAIEHLEYPRDLRFPRIVEFKHKLTEKIQATHQRATSDASYTTFLKHFGEFKVAKLDKKEVSGQEYILEELKNLRSAMQELERHSRFSSFSRRTKGDVDICLKGKTTSEVADQYELIAGRPDVQEALIERHGDHAHLVVNMKPGAESARDELRRIGHASRTQQLPRKRNAERRGDSPGTEVR